MRVMSGCDHHYCAPLAPRLADETFYAPFAAAEPQRTPASHFQQKAFEVTEVALHQTRHFAYGLMRSLAEPNPEVADAAAGGSTEIAFSPAASFRCASLSESEGSAFTGMGSDGAAVVFIPPATKTRPSAKTAEAKKVGANVGRPGRWGWCKRQPSKLRIGVC
jgi:hypothetical protein